MSIYRFSTFSSVWSACRCILLYIPLISLGSSGHLSLHVTFFLYVVCFSYPLLCPSIIPSTDVTFSLYITCSIFVLDFPSLLQFLSVCTLFLLSSGLLFLQISLSFHHVHSSDLFFVLWSACVSGLFSLFRCPVWRKGFLIAFCYFSPKRLCLPSFHSSDCLCVHVIYSLSILCSRMVFYTSLGPVFSLTLFFCLLSIFPLHLIFHVTFLLSTSKSVYFPPVLVLTYNHHTLTEHVFSIMSYWDFYWNFIPWVISAHHCWQRTVLYPVLCRVLYTFGV